MKRLLILLTILMPLAASAQQLKVYTDADNYNYFALYAYGLSREVVKTNSEIKESKYKDTGIMRRNHTTKYIDAGVGTEGYNANQKLSFGFLIAPYNVNAKGEELKEDYNQEEINWYEASGWDEGIDTEKAQNAWGHTVTVNNLSEASIINSTPTGCAAYKGPKGTDKPGTWRLPTQRETLTMFTIMEHALTMQGANQVENKVINGKYWTCTEFQTSANWKVWYVDSSIGSVIHVNKIEDGGAYSKAFARCVRDLDNEPINE